MGTVRPITDRMYSIPDLALAEEVARHAVDAFPMVRDLGEGFQEPDVAPAELAAEYAALVAYAISVAAGDGEVTFTAAEVSRADGLVATYRDLAAIKPDEWPRALLTAALQARAVRKALDRAEQQFAALLWTARGQAEVQGEDE